MRIAAATPSQKALEAAMSTASAGGGAVDAAIAAAAVAMVTEVGICAPGSGGFLTVVEEDRVHSYDGYVAAPGLGARDAPRPHITEVTMAYGGGITTLIGPASVATPGIWAALAEAHGAHGRIEWRRLLEPAVRLARGGFSFGPASLTYLRHSHHLVYGHDPASFAAIHHSDGTLRSPGDLIEMPDLADSLELIAEEGASSLHGGSLGAAIADDLRSRGGRLTATDLAEYRCIVRPPLTHVSGPWEIATNPIPAVGGEALIALLEELTIVGTDADAHVSAQRRTFERRRAGDPLRAGSTIQVSVVDEHGTGCSLTASSGYGSGVIPTGTGMWMNNALGELELVPDHTRLSPGERLVSNMAPTICRHEDGTVLAIGSPGADRITSALAQVLAALTIDGDDLGDAVRRPRLHVDVGPERRISAEPGTAPIELDGFTLQRFDRPHMFFGGVAAAVLTGDGVLEAVADPRRDGAAGVS